MKRLSSLAFSLAVIASASAFVSTSQAAGGTGIYATWTASGTTVSAAVAGTAFPTISGTVVDGTVSTAVSATLTGSSPFGQAYGTSSGKTYLSNGLSAGKNSSTTTLTFSAATPVGTWGFALGDVDAESVTVTATNATGTAVSTANWFQSSFNYQSGNTDQPTWNSANTTLVGNAIDTSGAAGWFKPTVAIKTITLVQTKLSGFPSYQLWLATDTQPIPAVTPTASASVTPTASSSVTPNASSSATPTATATASTSTSPTASQSATASASATTRCTSTDTALVNGSFEDPAIPANSYRQLLDSQVPGWTTTATDRKIEIWSSGFNSVTSPSGQQFAELNATQDSELFQEVATVPGQKLVWSLYHRARGAGSVGDAMSVNIGAANSAPYSVAKFTDTLSQGWVLHTGSYVVPAGQTSTRFGFESGATASGNKSVGNFLDHIYFTREICVPAEALVPPGETKPVATPTLAPTVTPSTGTPSNPLINEPGKPVVIEIKDIQGVPEGSTISDVKAPAHGDVAIIDKDTFQYTPKPEYIGEENITVVIKDRDGKILTVETVVAIGIPQVVINWKAPAKLHAGNNIIVNKVLKTNAGQKASIVVTCGPLLRSRVMDAMADCLVKKNGNKITVWVSGDVPIGADIALSAPAKGKYLELDSNKFIRN